MTPEEAGALYDSQMGGSSMGFSAEEAGALYDSQLTTPSLEATNIGGEGLTKFRPAVVGATARNILDYMTLGGADEIVGGGNAAIDYLFSNPEKKSIGELYDSRKAQSQLAAQALEEQLPDASTASKAIGLAASLRMPLPGVKTNKTGIAGLLSKTGQNAAIGAGLSELQAGLSTDGDLMTRVNAASEAAPIGALFGGGAGLLGEGLIAGANKLTKAGKDLKVGALGITANDIKKANRSLSTSDKIAGSTSPLLKAVDAIEASGTLKKGVDPEKLLPNVLSEIQAKNKSVLSLIKKADEVAGAGEKAFPKFSATEKYINRLKGTEQETALNVFQKELNAQVDTLSNYGNLQDWQNAKVSLQGMSKYGTEESKIANDITTLMASDVKRHIEKGVDSLLPKNLSGQVKKLNAEVGQRRPLVKILERNLAKDQSGNLAKNLLGLIRTTGGAGTAILATAYNGGDTKDIIGAGIGGAMLSSRGAQFKAGKILQAIGEKGASINPATLGLLGIASQKPESKAPAQPLDAALSELIQPTESDQLIPGQDLSLSDIQEEDMPKAEDIKLDVLPTDKTKRIKTVENLIDSDPIDATIYQIESNRNPKAKNPDSSASGGFQLLKKTAANLGVKDVFDLADNYKGYLKLKEENQNVLSNLGLDPQDPEALYSLHYLGSPVFRKVALKKPLTETEQEQVAYLKKTVLPRFRKIYTQKTMMV